MTVTYNPLEAGFTSDPYPQYEALRAEDPVHHSPLGVWVLVRYDDVLRFLRDPQLSVDERNGNPTPSDELVRSVVGDERAARGSEAMLNRDPPDHTRLRRLVSKAFTPRRIEELRTRVEDLVEQSLGRAEGEDQFDLIAELAFPLPFAVISEMLGMPEADRDQLREWSGTLVSGLEPQFDVDLIKARSAAGDAMSEFLTEVIAWKRANPSGDLLSALVAAEEHGDMLSDTELLEQVMLLYIAGHETTVNLIGNGTLALLNHRSELERLHHDPALVPTAVDELLRYDSPVQMTRRITVTDVELGGKTIEAGSFVAVMLASANRDDAKWGPTADRVDVSRADVGMHVAFGGGAHHCLGAALARLEGQVAIGALARRAPRLQLAGDPEWNGRINLRGLSRLPVTLRA